MHTPSKKFILRAGIVLVIIVITLTLQSSWFRNRFVKKPQQVSIMSQTVGDVLDKDSNGNGIPDWEEKLWGLDPTVLYTNGVSNKEIIEQKRKSLGGDDKNLPNNETDRVARELFILTSALGQSGELDNDALKKVGGRLSESIRPDQVTNHYFLKDIKTVPTTEGSLNSYHEKVITIARSYDALAPDIEILITALENDDYSHLDQLKITAANYKKLAGQLAGVPVPIGVAAYHMEIINGLYGMAQSFDYIDQLGDNSISGLAGVAIYKNFALRYQTALINVNTYLQSYGIL